jgi:hypothetical protein
MIFFVGTLQDCNPMYQRAFIGKYPKDLNPPEIQDLNLPNMLLFYLWAKNPTVLTFNQREP